MHTSPQLWRVVIFVVDGNDNHCGIDVVGRGLADCSLAGARIIPWDHRSVPRGVRVAFDISVPNPERGISFALEPRTLMEPIIAQEKRMKGWHLTRDAPDFVRTIREVRSRDPDDVNCVEWLWLVLERAGVVVPNDVLTPRELRLWCQSKIGPETILHGGRVAPDHQVSDGALQ